MKIKIKIESKIKLPKIGEKFTWGTCDTVYTIKRIDQSSGKIHVDPAPNSLNISDYQKRFSDYHKIIN